MGDLARDDVGEAGCSSDTALKGQAQACSLHVGDRTSHIADRCRSLGVSLRVRRESRVRRSDRLREILLPGPDAEGCMYARDNQPDCGHHNSEFIFTISGLSVSHARGSGLGARARV